MNWLLVRIGENKWRPIKSMPKRGYVWVTRNPDWERLPEGFMRTFCSPQRAHFNKDKNRIELANGCPVFQPLLWKW
jgi:hypothetical protein